MKFYVTRPDYERYWILAGIPAGTPGEDELRDRLLDEEYPKTTSQAVIELRARGLDADVNGLNYLLRKGEIPDYEADGRHASWTPELIDCAADALAKRGQYTPSGNRALIDGTSLGQEKEAQVEFIREHSIEAFEYANRIVEKSGRLGHGIHNRVRYEFVSPKEIKARDDWKRRR